MLGRVYCSRIQNDADVLVRGWIGTLELPGLEAHGFSSSAQRDARPETPEHAEEHGATVLQRRAVDWPHLVQGRDAVDVHEGPNAMEFRWHHTDDGDRVIVDANDAADDARIAGETRLPGLVRENDRRVRERAAILVRQKGPPEQWAKTEHREVIGGCIVDPDAIRSTIRVELDDSAREGCKGLEQRGVRAVVAKIGKRQLVRLWHLLVGSSEDDEARAIRAGQRLEQEIIDDAVHGTGHADAEGEREPDDGDEPGASR